MTNTELKPCPFCGNDKNHRGLSIGADINLGNTNKDYYVYCHTCACRGGIQMNEALAIKTWNRRTQ